MTDKQRFSSIWDAIEDTPQEAASMRARSALMMNLSEAEVKKLNNLLDKIRDPDLADL